MSIEDIIKRTGDTPITADRLVSDLRTLGVEPGMTLLVHSSLSRIGFVCGGAQAVVLALQEALGDTGTLVMPAHTAEWSEPSFWEAPAVPESWWPVIRAHWPAYDPYLTPTWKMGAIAEAFRAQRGTLRSEHPEVSFAARGPNAELITADHRLASRSGDYSPLAKLYELDSSVLLLGVGHGNNTSLHHAESRAEYPNKRYVRQGSAAKVNGQRQWVEYKTMCLRDHDFVTIGQAFEAVSSHTTIGHVGLAESRLMRQRPLVDFAEKWMNENR